MALPPFAAIDDRVSIAGQIAPADMTDLGAAGFTAVVNNRPDGEAMFGQPRTADLKLAAEQAGMVFLDLPFAGPRATPDQVRAFAGLLAKNPGPVLVYCKSGMRSAFLWGAASIAAGRSLQEILAAAMRAGQNLEPISDTMTALAKASQ